MKSPLDYYKDKVIRYWLVGGGTDVCSFGKLISWDDIGILLGQCDDEGKGIDGSEFYTWDKIHALGYFEGDGEDSDD